jgi:hypothetical protein
MAPSSSGVESTRDLSARRRDFAGYLLLLIESIYLLKKQKWKKLRYNVAANVPDD